MIYLVAKNFVQPEHIDQFKALADELIKASLQEEECAFYDLTIDDRFPFQLTFIEGWLAEDALTRHQQTEHYLDAVPKLKDLCSEPGQWTQYHTF